MWRNTIFLGFLRVTWILTFLTVGRVSKIWVMEYTEKRAPL